MQAAIYARFGNTDKRQHYIKRAALYARYSSDNQRYESITAQLRCSEEYCARKHYQVVKIYKDEAISGTSVVRRDAFQQMILDSADDVFDVVIFHKIDRNARNEIDYYTNVDRLAKNGVSYEYSAEGIDVTTANGKLTEGIKVAVAAWYSRNLSLEIKKGKKETALQGKHNGGSAPFGYDVADGKYIINESEAAAVKTIFEMRSKEAGYTAIIDWLNKHGYKTKRGNAFGKNSLHDILINKKYIGVLQHNKTTKHNSHALNVNCIEIKNALPAIIDENLFYAVQGKMQKYVSGGRRKAVVDYALSGKVFCACGSGMYGYTSGRTSKHYYHYVCKDKVYKHSGCKSPRLKKDELENLVFNLLTKELLYSRDEILSYFEKLNNNTEVKQQLTQLKKQIKKREQKLSRLLDLYSDTGDAAIADKYKTVKYELATIKKEYSELEKSQHGVDIKEVGAYLDYLVSQKVEDVDKKQLFDLFVNKITVYDKNIEVNFNINVYSTMVALTGIEPVISP